MGKPREFWIGVTADGFEKWLTRKHPEETTCRNVFISTDGSDPCVEYVPVIEKSAYDELVGALEDIDYFRTRGAPEHIYDIADRLRWVARNALSKISKSGSDT